MLELFRKGLVEPAFWALVFQTIVANVLPFALQRWMLGRMDPEARSRTWNGLTWGVAVLAVNSLSMLPFAWVTRPQRGAATAAAALFYGVVLSLSSLVIVAAINSIIGGVLVGDLDFGV